ncbi:beta-N-acetylhexosaminidase [Desulfacinum infernum DSM 9756]|uniref:Beta-N-acetylhexosaminidase n=1 Tax=Desulfacinum infernum DSM 9756 TaxID=1121391 RepID=A0A1M5B097_9BACT|nr:glycoside hydrolase family 3 N-terminal domain-containing protein [Desulfacinum infernum]SHF35934.1 beta-N-acetylhexosaminidase [Desulfacinum infernum DSM 9756]
MTALDTTILDAVGRHLFLGFNGTTPDGDLRARLRFFRPGGLVLFRRNIESEAQLRDLVAAVSAWALEELKRPLLWAIDEEGGTVQRLRAIHGSMPSALELASRGPSEVERVADETAGRLRRLGISINFAPVLDVVEDPDRHFLGTRALGSDPEEVGELGARWIRAQQALGVLAVAKHFPGLGPAGLDPHDHLPVLKGVSRKEMTRQLLPFRRAVEAGVAGVMTSHAVYECWDEQWPGTLSSVINRGILREQLGFQGVLFSDDLDMEAIRGRYEPETLVRQTLLATVDALLVCQHEEGAEPLLRALHDAVRRHADLRDAHRKSLERQDSALALCFDIAP